MGHKFAEIAFTPAVCAVQSDQGSRGGYAGMSQGVDYNHLISEREASFITARDSFYMASVGETGWPYVQHRGGPAGFIKVLDANTLGFADYSGNRQYISTGNFGHNDRVALFFMDYPHRTRLKLLGRVQVIDLQDSETLSRLEDDHYRAQIERGFVIHVEAFDWNCPQHITPRYTEAEFKEEYKEEFKQELKEELKEEFDPAAGTSPSAESRSADQDHSAATVQQHSIERSDRTDSLGEGELELVISGIRQLSPRVRAYELRAPDDAELPPIAAGSHLLLPITLESGEVVQRHYSIASNPARRDIYEVAVLREADGGGGSRALHASYRLGMQLRTALPGNYFSLDPQPTPTVLIAAGIGITPIKAMAQHLTTLDRPFKLHYAGRSGKEMPYRDRLQREFGQQIRLYAGDQGERLDIENILISAPNNTLFYLCGPTRLIDNVIAVAEANGISPDRIRYELFQSAVAADSRPIQVELARSGKTLAVGSDQTILDALLSQGINQPYSCKTGQCKTCAIKVLDGEPEHRDTALSGDERNSLQLMTPCVSRAKTDHLVLDL
ncbi:MAG: 2Fe-2S iron-sulfur cluster-binding protein [Halopseudomonas sp.]